MDDKDALGIFRVSKGHFRRTIVLFASMNVLCSLGETSSGFSIILIYWSKVREPLSPEDLLALTLVTCLGLLGFVLLQKYMAAKAIVRHVCRYMSPSFFGLGASEGREIPDPDHLAESVDIRRQAIVDLIWKERLMANIGVVGYVGWWGVCAYPLYPDIATFAIILGVGVTVNTLYFIRLQEFNPIPLLCHNTVQSRRLITMLEREEDLRRDLELARPLPLVRWIGSSFNHLMSILWSSVSVGEMVDRRDGEESGKPRRSRIGTDVLRHRVTSYHIYSTAQFLFMMIVVMITVANIQDVEDDLTRFALVLMVSLQMITLFVVQLYRFFMRTMPRDPDDHESRAVAEAFGIISESVAHQERMARIAKYDQDLGIPRRWVFDQAFADGVRAFMRARRGRRSAVTKFSIIFLDVDHFGQVNKRFGHQAGDLILAEVADVIAEVMDDVGRRGTDAFARFGGEEFVMFFANAGLEHAHETAEKIRQRIFEIPRLRGLRLLAEASYDGWDQERVSVSAGVVGSDQPGFDEVVLVDGDRVRDEPEVVVKCLEIANFRLSTAKNDKREVDVNVDGKTFGGLMVRNRIVKEGWEKEDAQGGEKSEAAPAS